MRVFVVVAILVAGFVVPAGALAQNGDQQPLATPDPNFAGTFNGSQFDDQPVLKKKCVLDTADPYEKRAYESQGWDPANSYERYPGSCVRMRFAYGPIAVQPGKNDVLIGPVTIEKPVQDGFITKFKPNLTRTDGTVPPVHEVHLHHGTWLNLSNGYGPTLPFFAAGEEKTIANFPRNYGLEIKATDQWQFLYMVHSAVQDPFEIYITYEVDFVPKNSPAAANMIASYPLWIDVRPSSYPVFNVQRKYGGEDGVCRWPAEKCADFNSFGDTEVGQGRPGNGVGKDYVLPAAGEPFGRHENWTGGTIIGLGGHMHPGGIRNELDLVRNGQQKRIYTSDPSYWHPDDKTQRGGPPDSWDFSARVNGLPKYGIHVEPGDILRSNAVYDTTIQSTYENMGIVVSYIAPEDENGNKQAPGVNPFEVEVDSTSGCESGGLLANPPKLCPNGMTETHGHYKENGYRGGPSGTWAPAANGPLAGETNQISIADFLYVPGDLNTYETLGVPKVPLGTDLRFTNAEGGGVLHTITSCAFPCLGATGAAFPVGDGESSTGRMVEMDSGQLGYAAPEISGAKNEINWTLPVKAEEGYEAGEIVTYYCRIHPSMRGAFEVTQ